MNTETECIFNAKDLVLYLKSKLDLYFANRKWNGVQYKNAVEADDFKSDIPKVYPFLCPPDEISANGYPFAIPSITIVVNSITPSLRQDQTVSLSFHTALCNPSTSDKETASQVKDEENRYQLGNEGSYTNSQAQFDLYTQALQLSQQVVDCLVGIASQGLRITDLSVTPPSTSLEDFPYATSVITCNINITQLLTNTYTQQTDLRNKIMNLL